MKIIAQTTVGASLRQNAKLFSLDEEKPDVTLIQLESNEDGNVSSELKGLDYVLRVAKEGKPIVMVSLYPESRLADDFRWQAAMGYPNVSYTDIIGVVAKLAKKIEESEKQERPKNELAIELSESQVRQSAKSRIAHDLRNSDNSENPKDKERVTKLLLEARELFGDLPETELREIIFETKAEPSRFEGRRFENCFSDVEGTLIQNKQINKNLLAELQEKAKTKPVTIWTDGDIKFISQQLREAGITWQIVSKEMMAGITAGEVYDDMSREDFEKTFRINPETFHQVSKTKEEVLPEQINEFSQK